MSKEKEILCDSCNQPMKLLKRTTVLSATIKNKKFRKRRFWCNICDIGKTIYADGHFDEDVNPFLVQEESKSLFKEQEENNKR